MSHNKIINVINNHSKLSIGFTYCIVYSINSYIFAELKYRNYESIKQLQSFS